MITQLSTIAFPYEPKDASSTQSAKQREFDLVCVVCVCVCVCMCVGLPSYFFSLSLARARTDVCMLEQSRQGGLVHSALLAVDKQDQDAQVCVHVSASARTLSQTLFSLSFFSLSLTRSSLARSLLRALSPPALALAGGYCGGEHLP